MTRMITNTAAEAQHPWPEEVFVQGGGSGIVFDGPNAYRTAFVEAMPGGTFLRGEGATIGEAEDACWAKYQTFAQCDGQEPAHGPYERRQYTNGAGFCTRCGTWMNRVLPALPEPPRKPREGRLLDRLFADRDPAALDEVVDAITRIDELPAGPTTTDGSAA